MRFLLAGALALSTAGAAAAHPVAQSAEAVLAANHAAVGDLPAKGGLTLDYAYAGDGLTGTATEIRDLATGAFVQDMTAGPASQATGYDGKTPWMRDISGANTSQEGGDRIPVAVSEAYRGANLWWRGDRGGAAVSYVGRETADGATLDHLTVTPKGGKRFDAWFDADSHLLTRIAEEQQFFHTQTLYGDYRPEGGVTVAHAVTIDFGTGKDSLQTLKLNRLTVGPARPLAAYARPTAAPTGAALDGGVASLTVPFRLLNNHIYVQATVNGKGPYTFIVDTGGHNLLSPRVVAETGLNPQGAAATSGVGEKTETSGFAKVSEIALGGVRMHDQTAFTIEVYAPEIEGIRVDGMVGFELFRRFAVTVDYGAQTLTFTDPARFDPAGAGTALKFKFYDHLPQVDGLIADIPARFDIDTGSRSEVDITSPTVARHQLRARFPKGVSAITGWGVGGASRDYAVRLPSITLGGVRVEAPTGGLSEAKNGSISDPNFEGNVGSGFLKRFVVTFDYAHQRMYLKPIIPAPADAGRFDRAGMWINASPQGYVVTDVSVGGPAAEAGLLKGDVITALDGQPARMEGLSDARMLLRERPAGTKMPATVSRGGASTQVAIVLRDQI
jgi:hypothetical protein